MTYLNTENLSPEASVAEFVIASRGTGNCLPYLDYQVIGEWTKASEDTDQLLLILDDLLPSFFDDGKRPRSIAPLRKRVLKKLSDLRG